jgi:hypothetical protein
MYWIELPILCSKSIYSTCNLPTSSDKYFLFACGTYTDVLVKLNMKYMYELTGISYSVCTGKRCTVIGRYELEVEIY